MRNERGRSRARLLVAVAMSSLLVLAACAGDTGGSGGGGDGGDGSGGSGGSSGSGGSDDVSRVVIGWNAVPDQLDSGKPGGPHESTMLGNIYDSLTWRDLDGSVHPALAVEWDNNEDATEWTLTLREDVKFHNGETMTADDVVYSMERLADTEYLSDSKYRHLESVEAIDDLTVRIRLSTPDPLFISFSPVFTPIVPRAVGEEFGYAGYGSSPESSIGTGPYRVVELVPDERLVLAAFEDYWDGKPEIDEVVVREIPDATARSAALQAGEVDVINEPPSEHYSVIDNHDDLEIRLQTGSIRFVIQLNTLRAPLDDIRVRQAIAHALDIDAVIEHVMNGIGESIATMKPPTVPGHHPDLEPYPYDPDRARELLAEAGYPDGQGLREFQFYTRQGEKNAETLIQALAAQLDAVGISTNLHILGSQDWEPTNVQKIPDMNVWTYRGAFHADRGLSSFNHMGRGSAAWSGYYVNPEVERLLDEALALTATDVEGGLQLYYEAQEVIYDDFALAGAWTSPCAFGVRSSLNWDPPVWCEGLMYKASWN